jgi:hypothetical protein
MPPDLLNETLVTFPGLAKHIPPRRKGKPAHVSSIHRYRNPGIEGIRLEAVRVGGIWMTSLEAFARFCARLTAAKEGAEPTATTPAQSPSAQADDRELERKGW